MASTHTETVSHVLHAKACERFGALESLGVEPSRTLRANFVDKQAIDESS